MLFVVLLAGLGAVVLQVLIGLRLYLFACADYV